VLSPLAAALHVGVLAHRRAKVPLVVLRKTARDADLSLAASPEARERLAAALDELAAAALVTLPKSRVLWERSASPPLPAHVTRARAESAPERPVAPGPPEPVWHALLSWVPAFLACQRPTTTERTLLLGVQGLLGSAGGLRPPVPLRERSLQLLGDEKALDSLMRGRLFGPRRLTLELLAAERVAPALVETATSLGPDVLLVENYATFFTLGRALAGHGNIGRVIWGAGNQVTTFLPQLVVSPAARIWYFGDLDIRGLEIGAGATVCASKLGLPPLAACADLYALLLKHGYRAPAGGRAATTARAAGAVRWLPRELRAAASRLLGDGHRLAQEAVGVDLLAALELPDPMH
jgi:hypothetical protein